MERTVLSMFVTTPRVSPSEGLLPTPRTLKRPPSSAEATTLHTLVVPISKPTIISLSIHQSLSIIPSIGRPLKAVCQPVEPTGPQPDRRSEDLLIEAPPPREFSQRCSRTTGGDTVSLPCRRAPG